MPSQPVRKGTKCAPTPAGWLAPKLRSESLSPRKSPGVRGFFLPKIFIPMDILDSRIFTKKYVEALVEKTESKYPRLKAENEKIRSLAGRGDVAEILSANGVDIDAALLSDCRTDSLNCGRCAFWRVLRESGVSF